MWYKLVHVKIKELQMQWKIYKKYKKTPQNKLKKFTPTKQILYSKSLLNNNPIGAIPMKVFNMQAKIFNTHLPQINCKRLTQNTHTRYTKHIEETSIPLCSDKLESLTPHCLNSYIIELFVPTHVAVVVILALGPNKFNGIIMAMVRRKPYYFMVVMTSHLIYHIPENVIMAYNTLLRNASHVSDSWKANL